MYYEDFQNKVNKLTDKMGFSRGSTKFNYDDDKGLFTAKCADGTYITGNNVSVKECPDGVLLHATISWGDKHRAQAWI